MKTINDYLDDIDTIFYYQTKGVSKKPAVRKVLEELVNSIKLKRNTGLVRTGYYSNDFYIFLYPQIL